MRLKDSYLIVFINAKVIPVATYLKNIWNFSYNKLKELDQIIKWEIECKKYAGKTRNCIWPQKNMVSDISLSNDLYKKRRIRGAWYMQKLTKRWIKATWKIVLLNEENAMVNKSATTMKLVRVKLTFRDSTIQLVD